MGMTSLFDFLLDEEHGVLYADRRHDKGRYPVLDKRVMDKIRDAVGQRSNAGSQLRPERENGHLIRVMIEGPSQGRRIRVDPSGGPNNPGTHVDDKWWAKAAEEWIRAVQRRPEGGT